MNYLIQVPITDPDEDLADWTSEPSRTLYIAEVNFLDKVVRFPAVPIAFGDILRIAGYITARETIHERS